MLRFRPYKVCAPVVFVSHRQAEDLINNGFPRKIVELNDLLATPLFSTKNLEEVHEDLRVPVPPPMIKIGNKLENLLFLILINCLVICKSLTVMENQTTKSESWKLMS